jgi:phospholipid-binding lipoprotein MlaA
MMNSLLQGDFANFELTLHRFIVNSTLGMGGVNDVAAAIKLPAGTKSDFGQTLGSWGADHGFYLVIPIIGSSSFRDGTGRIVDTVADPFNIVWHDSETEWPIYTRAGVSAVDARSKAGGAYDDVMNSAVDPYVTFRSIYVQQRAYMVQNQASDSYAKVEAQ